MESACRRMRLDGSMAEGNKCVVVVVVGDEWLLDKGQLVEGGQPTGGSCLPRVSSPGAGCSLTVSSPGGHARLGRVALLLAEAEPLRGPCSPSSGLAPPRSLGMSSSADNPSLVLVCSCPLSPRG